jgi:histidinol-phosphate aminotransferase
LPAKTWLERLRARKILVRWFATRDVSQYLRISVGTDREAKALIAAVRAILTETSRLEMKR